MKRVFIIEIISSWFFPVPDNSSYREYDAGSWFHDFSVLNGAIPESWILGLYKAGHATDLPKFMFQK